MKTHGNESYVTIKTIRKRGYLSTISRQVWQAICAHVRRAQPQIKTQYLVTMKKGGALNESPTGLPCIVLRQSKVSKLHSLTDRSAEQDATIGNTPKEKNAYFKQCLKTPPLVFFVSPWIDENDRDIKNRIKSHLLLSLHHKSNN